MTCLPRTNQEHASLRICAGASAGGHLSQLLRLSDAWRPYSVFFVSTLSLVEDHLGQYGRVYTIGECNRRHPFRALAVVVRSYRVVARERPDVVLTTGSFPLAILAIIAKIGFGAKVIWVDSVTNVHNLSMSGRLMRHFADLILTQWPHLSEPPERVEFSGAIV